MYGQVRVVTSALLAECEILQWQANRRVDQPVVQFHPTDSPAGAGCRIQNIFAEIFRSLDSSDYLSARDALVELGERLKVSTGHIPRTRGGIQYRPEFMLDSIHFTDCLRPLKDDVDVMRDALEKRLDLEECNKLVHCTIVLFCFFLGAKVRHPTPY